jgi:hypothetical protein
MKITDEKLSAFLDAELAPNEMEVIRLALEVDDNLVMRLAELSQVDQWVLENAEVIDAKPITQALVDLAQQIDKREKVSPEKSNVIQMSAWKKVTSKINTPMSVAAGVVLAITVGVATMNQQQEQSLSNQMVNVLDTVTSGQTSTLDKHTSIKTQLSFANKNGDLCRQYLLIEEQVQSSNIACKENNHWRIHATIETNQLNTQGYQAASSTQDLDKVIDGMIVGSPLNRDQEQKAISTQWKSK